jgi:hypothetical protein
MDKRIGLTLITLLIAFGQGFSSSAETLVADTVYKNGKVYTVNEKQTWAKAVANTMIHSSPSIAI